MIAYGRAIGEINDEWAKNDERHSFIPEIRIAERATEILYGEKSDDRAA
jgi:hypothetical protein